MSRLFTFGCSFTKYNWDTWADILGQQFDSYKNYGRPGSGNLYALNQLTQSYLRDNINANDTVAIMWSTTYREDRFVKGEWHTPGNVYNSNYPDNWVNDWCDPEGFLVRDLSFIASAKLALDNIGCNYYMFQMMDIKTSCEDYEMQTREIFRQRFDVFKKLFSKKSIGEKYIELYEPILDCLYPSMHSIVYNNDWCSREDELTYRFVPTQEILADKWDNWKGDDWPSLDEWISGKVTEYEDEIRSYLVQDHNYVAVEGDNSKLKIIDYHPTTSMHLEYLQKVLPNYDRLA